MTKINWKNEITGTCVHYCSLLWVEQKCITIYKAIASKETFAVQPLNGLFASYGKDVQKNDGHVFVRKGSKLTCRYY